MQDRKPAAGLDIAPFLFNKNVHEVKSHIYFVFLSLIIHFSKEKFYTDEGLNMMLQLFGAGAFPKESWHFM